MTEILVKIVHDVRYKVASSRSIFYIPQAFVILYEKICRKDLVVGIANNWVKFEKTLIYMCVKCLFYFVLKILYKQWCHSLLIFLIFSFHTIYAMKKKQQ